MPNGIKVSDQLWSWLLALSASNVLAFPPLDKLPILTLALESMKILKTWELSSAFLLAEAKFWKIASVSGILRSGFIFWFFLNDNPFDLKYPQ